MTTEEQIEALESRCEALESAIFDILDIMIEYKETKSGEYQEFVGLDAESVKDSLQSLLKIL